VRLYGRGGRPQRGGCAGGVCWEESRQERDCVRAVTYLKEVGTRKHEQDFVGIRVVARKCMEGWLRGARMKTKGVTMREGEMSGEGVGGWTRDLCARDGCFEVGEKVEKGAFWGCWKFSRQNHAVKN
jgi:hypothetical protein